MIVSSSDNGKSRALVHKFNPFRITVFVCTTERRRSIHAVPNLDCVETSRKIPILEAHIVAASGVIYLSDGVGLQTYIVDYSQNVAGRICGGIENFAAIYSLIMSSRRCYLPTLHCNEILPASDIEIISGKPFLNLIHAVVVRKNAVGQSDGNIGFKHFTRQIRAVAVCAVLMNIARVPVPQRIKSFQRNIGHFEITVCVNAVIGQRFDFVFAAVTEFDVVVAVRQNQFVTPQIVRDRTINEVFRLIPDFQLRNQRFARILVDNHAANCGRIHGTVLAGHNFYTTARISDRRGILRFFLFIGVAVRCDFVFVSVTSDKRKRQRTQQHENYDKNEKL